MQTIIAGSRNIYWPEFVDLAIDGLTYPTTVSCGEAKGMDKAGKDWAEVRCIPVKSFPAIWSNAGVYNNSAGMERNTLMAKESQQLVLLYDGASRGSTHMLTTAIKEGLAVKAAILRFKVNENGEQLLDKSNLLWINKYRPQEVVSFLKTNEVYGFYSNMAKGYDFKINGINIHSSEHLYQALKFDDGNIQEEILSIKNPWQAKKLVTSLYNKRVNKDWLRLRDAVMVLCIGLKILLSEKFLSDHNEHNHSNKPIVEFSYKDPYWGAIPNPDNTLLIGFNRLGYILNLQFNTYSRTGEPLIQMNLPLKLLGVDIEIVLEEMYANNN